MRVVIAPDKFKGSFTSGEVARAMAQGVRTALPHAEVVVLPMADGGDGTLDALTSAGWQRHTCGEYGYVSDGSTACVELASVCGLVKSMRENGNAWLASTRPLGELMRCVAESGVRRLWVALGGSASTDGGVGLLQGLGFAVTDDAGLDVVAGVPGVIAARSIGPTPPYLEHVDTTVLSDVLVPLLGPTGAALFFGPRKGLPEEEVQEAESAMMAWSALLEERFGVGVSDIPGSGGAGGTGAALIALGARVASGAITLAHTLKLSQELVGADLVITGEGSFDESSLKGKVTGLVANSVLSPGARVLLVTGQKETEFRSEGIAHRVDHLCPQQELSLVDIATQVEQFCEEMVNLT